MLINVKNPIQLLARIPVQQKKTDKKTGLHTGPMVPSSYLEHLAVQFVLNGDVNPMFLLLRV